MFCIVRSPVLLDIIESVALWYILKSALAPKATIELSVQTVYLKVLSAKLPSNLKYSANPPLPSSLLNIISLSSALLVIYKSPVRLSITESVPLWNICASALPPNSIGMLSLNLAPLANTVLTSLPSKEKYVAKPPDRDWETNISQWYWHCYW